jgi:polyphenol oxidase
MSVPTEIIINQFAENQILAENGFYWREKDGVKILVCQALEEKGFNNGFSTRTGGVSDFPQNSLNLAGYDEDLADNIAENRHRFLGLFDKNYTLSTVWQIHSDLVKTVENLDEAHETNEKFDALVSNLDEVLIGVKTADCVPVLLGDPKTGSFAAIHAGWRGTVESIVPKAIEKMQANYGTNPKDLIAAIGAAATCKNYEIGQDVIDAFTKNFADADKLFTPTRTGHALIDLHLANKNQLLDIGVLPENIYIVPLCTIERTDLFFSYRVEKKKFGKTGRLLSVIGKK